MARREAVAAKQRDERRARLRRDRQTRLAHLGIDETDQIPFPVGVAGERGGVLRALAYRAQRRAALEVAGLDHDPAIRRRRLQQRFDRGSKVAAPTCFHPDRAPAPEQWNGVDLLDQPGGRASKVIAVDARELKRVFRIIDRGAHERFHALAHQPRVRAEDEHDRARRIRARDEPVDVGAFQGDHRCFSRATETGG